MEEMKHMDGFSEGPREKLELKGQGALSDKELIMLLLGQGTAGHPVEELAKEVLRKLDKKPDITVAELKNIPGMGSAKASTVIAAVELGRRKSQRKPRAISTPKDIYDEIRHFASRDQEHLVVMSLNGAHEVINVQVATIGLLDKTVVHPREVFSAPIRDRAAAIAIAHNHPSGKLDPSEDDKMATVRLLRSGEVLGIKVIDHLVFSEDGYYSFLEHGILEG